MLRGLLRAQLRRASSITGVDQARLRLLEDLRPKLAASGWEAEEVSVADRAAASAERALRLQDSELRGIAVQLAMQGNKRCAHSALSSRIGAEAEAVATAVFEQQYSRLMTELAQRSTDFWGAKQAVPAAQCVSPLAARLLSAARVDELLDTGVCVVDGALGPAEVLAARRELERVHGAGELRDAQQRGVRNDLVGWLDSSRLAATPALAPVVSLLRGLPAEIERHASSSGGPEWRLAVPAMVQAALYDGSGSSPSFYHRHIDCNDPSTNPRRLTAILYLNPEWDEQRDGGCLRAHLRGGGIRDVAPLAGRLLLFDAIAVEHEVMPAYAPRMAVTLWAFDFDACLRA